MMKDFTIEKLLDLKETMAAELFEGKTYPWEVLPEIKDFILKLGKTLDPDVYKRQDWWRLSSGRNNAGLCSGNFSGKRNCTAAGRPSSSASCSDCFSYKKRQGFAGNADDFRGRETGIYSRTERSA